MTEKLFYFDPYSKEAEAKVLSVVDKNVLLDRTIFFAFSGGQQSDSGTINGIPIEDVDKQGDKIIHTLSEKPDFNEGDTVKLVLDWEKRYKIMKLHTAAHIIYELLPEELKQKPLIGSNITSEKARLDFDYEKSVNEFLPELEQKTNDFLSQDHKVETKEDENDLKKRWWFCEQWKMPCSGTHVKSTKEIGRIKLKRKNLGKNKERIEITLV